MGQRHAAREGHLQVGEIEGAERLVIAERHEQRVESTEQSRLVVVKGLNHRGQIPRVRDKRGVSANTQGIHRRRKRIDMIDRQWLQHGATPPIDVVGLEKSVALQHIGNQIAVGQHRTLGHARGTTGVLQHRQLIAVQDHGAVRRFCAGLEHGVELERTGYRERRHHPLHIFHEKIDQSALRLRVKVRYLGDYNSLYTGLG